MSLYCGGKINGTFGAKGGTTDEYEMISLAFSGSRIKKMSPAPFINNFFLDCSDVQLSFQSLSSTVSSLCPLLWPGGRTEAGLKQCP